MDYLAEHRRMLELAAARALPRQIDENSKLSVRVCRELVEAGLLEAVDAHSFDGDAFLEPRITIPGREYLNGLQERAAAATPFGRAKRVGYILGGWIGGILTTVLAAWIVWRLGFAG